MPKQKTRLVHGDNLLQKEAHRTKYRDDESRRYLNEIRDKYKEWNAANLALAGPKITRTDADAELVSRRVSLFEQYKDFIDQQHYAEKFDSRSNLHSTVLEEFVYYLFKDLVGDFGEHALIGKSHTFKDIFFSPPSYTEMLKRPYAMIETKDHDFVIGATYEASFTSTTSLEEGSESVGETELGSEEKPAGYEKARVAPAVETHLFDIPAVAIECKTYFDKTMLEGSSRAAEEIKARNPNGMYIVVSEWLKLAEAVNLKKYKVDQIYVLRKQKNTDREFRYDPGYVKNPVDPAIVFHLFQTVRDHLTKDWMATIRTGLERGWLIE